jgi:hypothetical protein
MLKQILPIVALTLALSGCAADSGNTKLAKTSNEQINSAFEKGKTTQDEVKQAFGEPDDTDIMSDGRVKWVYTHIKRSAMTRNYIPVVNWFSSGTNDTTKKLVIIFKDGVLENLSSSTGKGESKAGLLG